MIPQILIGVGTGLLVDMLFFSKKKEPPTKNEPLPAKNETTQPLEIQGDELEGKEKEKKDLQNLQE